MEDIWRDGCVDIRQWERLPKRVEDGLDSIIPTSGMKDAYIAVGQSVCLKRFSIVPRREPAIVPKSTARDFTLGAFAIVSTRHQDLFWVVTNVTGQNGMAPAPDPIPTHHW